MSSVSKILRDHTYEVIVGNVGIVYTGYCVVESLETYERYVRCSKSGEGRAGYESVVLMRDGVIVAEHVDPNGPVELEAVGNKEAEFDCWD